MQIQKIIGCKTSINFLNLHINEKSLCDIPAQTPPSIFIYIIKIRILKSNYANEVLKLFDRCIHNKTSGSDIIKIQLIEAI